jgi:hypothetical protein
LDIKFVTYTRVEAGMPPKPQQLREIDEATAGFLGDHVDKLLKKATSGAAALAARFAEPDAHKLFRSLYRGTANEFLDAADRLAERLADAMDSRASDGLFVALRAESADFEVVAGVLKLQVVEGHGAVLQQLESGELQLAAVTDMLEQPGNLEKGALVAKSLKDGEVYCADRLQVKARYFPTALGIRRFAAPAEAAKSFFDTAQRVAPALVAQIAAAWPKAEPDYTREVLARLGDEVCGLTAEIQEKIIEALEAYPEPVAWLDTQRKVRESYKFGGITVSGPIEEMRQRISVAPQPEGGWQVVLETPEQPKVSHTASAARRADPS